MNIQHEFKQDKAQLRPSPDADHAPLLAALALAPVGVLSLAPDGLITWANRALADLACEPAPSALVGCHVQEWLAPADVQALEAALARHFATQQESRVPASLRCSLRLADTVAHSAKLTLTPFPAGPTSGLSALDEPAGQALLYVESQRTVAIAERRFEQMFEGLPIGLIIIDQRQHITQANHHLLEDFGYEMEELVGQPLTMLLPPRYRDMHSGHVENYQAAPSTRMMGSGRDLTGLHKSGQEIPVEIALTRLDSPREPLTMAIVSNIANRKRAEHALQQTNAQLEEFTYVASHDLRSPLRGIGDLVSWIREDLGEDDMPEDVRHNFNRIALRIDRAEQMIDDLLAYARAGIRDPQMELVDPYEVIEEAINMSAVPDGFRLEVDVKGEPFLGARTPISTSLRNLLANAVKHHGSNSGHIRISLREEGRFSVFSVEDDGPGVTSGNEDRIFKLFHRASPGTQGDGLGLAFTRRMINAHGGMITVCGKGDLGGARFEIHWPRILLREMDDHD